MSRNWTYRSFHFAVLLLLPFAMHAQPSPPSVTFTFVREVGGSVPPGPLAVEVFYNERPTEASAWPRVKGRSQKFLLVADTSDGQWPTYSLPDRWCTDLRLTITAGSDVMQIDLPDANDERWALVQQVMQRSGSYESPEVLPFRPGRYAFTDLANDSTFSQLEAELTRAMEVGRQTAYEKELAAQEEYYRNQPPAVQPSAPYAPPPPMTEAQVAAFWAQQPPLKEVRTVRVNADTVWLSITGRIMLDGGCGSSMPLFGLEMRTDTGWVERFPFDPSQMDCGLPWGDWTDHIISLPLEYWVGSRGRGGEKELLPGTYRLLFAGGNLQRVATEGFRIE